MTKNLRYAVILFTICAVCAFALALTNNITAPVIAQMDAQSRLDALQAVSAGYEIGTQTDVSDQKYVSYAIDLLEGKEAKGFILGLKTAGYGGEMTLVASYTSEGEVLYAQLLSHSETPGLGKKAEGEGYMDKFKGTGVKTTVPTSKSMLSSSDAQAVSGSSVTFTGIAKAIDAGSEYVKALGGAR